MSSSPTLSGAGASALALLLSGALHVAPLQAQAGGGSAPPPGPWTGTALANASLFFGNTQQQVLGADGKLARVDSSFGLTAELRATYGEASLESGSRTVTKRILMGTMTVNFRPLNRVSSFVTGGYQSNLEKRIASRYGAGVGAKWNIRQSKVTGASLSLSLSVEHTTARDSTVSFPDELIARFSWLATYRHVFGERLQIVHSTSWQPAANEVSRFLVVSNTELRYKMSGLLSLSVAFTDNYDSGAVERGARTKNDGQMLFGVAAGW